MVEMKLEESARLIEGLKREINGVERERSVKEVKIGEIQETNSHVFDGWKWNKQKQNKWGKLNVEAGLEAIQ